MGLEIYEPKHSGRVYLGNRCNFCFKINAIDMKKCSSCNIVSYCSKQHQKEDWKFHKPTCKALKVIRKQVEYPKHPNAETFKNYRETFFEAMIKYRKCLGPEYLTEYERQICLFQPVCLFCYSSETTCYCETCEIATYCSLEHRDCDRNHMDHCHQLSLYKLFSSLGYENGFKLDKFISMNYQPIRRSIKQLPKGTLLLGKLIQNQIGDIMGMDEDEFVSLSLFVEPYLYAASIINVMEKIGAIKKRKLQTPHKIYGNKTNKPPNTLTIHLIMTDNYELSFHWPKFVHFLTDWIFDLKKVKIVLTGPKLKDCFIPTFEVNEKYEIVVYSKSYHDVESISQPDIIVMYDSDRIFHEINNKYWSPSYQKFLFRFKNTPVVFFSGSDATLMTIFDFFSEMRDIKFKTSGENHLSDLKNISRVWSYDDNLGIHIKNFLFNVYTKC